MRKKDRVRVSVEDAENARDIRDAVDAAKTVLYGVNEDGPIDVDARFSGPEREQGSDYPEVHVSGYSVPVRSIGRTYIEAEIDPGHDHGGWIKITFDHINRLVVTKVPHESPATWNG